MLLLALFANVRRGQNSAICSARKEEIAPPRYCPSRSFQNARECSAGRAPDSSHGGLEISWRSASGAASVGIVDFGVLSHDEADEVLCETSPRGANVTLDGTFYERAVTRNAGQTLGTLA